MKVLATAANSSLPESSLAHTGVRYLAAGWLALALSALTIATACAVVLTIARTPWLSAWSTSGEFFGRTLVVHVTLAVVIWFLACAAAFWTLAAGAPGGAGAMAIRWASLTLAALGLCATVVSLFFDSAQPVLANYVPVLDHPAFLTGLVLFTSGVTLAGLGSLRGAVRQCLKGPAWRLGAVLSLVAAFIALGTWVVSFIALPSMQTPARFEYLAWGPGHVLQFVHVLLLMSVWTVLGEHLLGKPVASRRWLHGLLLLAILPLLALPLIYFNYPVDDLAFRRAFTLLMALGIWPAAALLGLRLLVLLKGAGQSLWHTPQALALLLSILLFLLGCGLGAMIQSDTTMVPAHYHGTVGAVTLAYMAMGYRLVPAFGAAPVPSHWIRWQVLSYGLGLMTLALALAWSGSMGVPRKTLHVEVMLQFPAYFVAMGLAGLGGLMAVAGAALFVVNVMRSLQTGRHPTAPRRGPRDIRWRAVAVTLGLTLCLGLLLSYWTPDQGEALPATVQSTRPATAPATVLKDAGGHAQQMRADEIRRRFEHSVTLLQARDFDATVAQLHRVLELAPQMPEAHVNMGFAMIGIQRYAAARDFFNAATELNVNQLNAYYGLALALEGLNDLPGAMGAMQTYIHLSGADDPFRAKAENALRKWRAAARPATN